MAYSTAANPSPQYWNRLDHEDGSGSLIRQQYDKQQALFHLQPASIQRQLETQAGQIAAEISQDVSQIKFELPDQIAVPDPDAEQVQLLSIPSRQRNQVVGGWWRRVARGGLTFALLRRFLELERSPEKAVSLCAGLLRHTTALTIVDDLLPSGHSMTWPATGEEVPRKRLYLRQLEAFDEGGNLQLKSAEETEAFLACMQGCLRTLQIASFLTPYIAVDEIYRQKQSWVTGQLMEQGRALAEHLTTGIIEKIQRRAAENNLNRGLSLSLPYFDDQELVLKTWDFVVIPAGRIGFDRRFLVGSALEEQARVAREARLSPSTRDSLSAQLGMLAQAFRLPSSHHVKR